MIITKEVKVKVISTTLKHYQDLGYDVKQGNTYLEVPVNHLTEGSKIEVLVKCDICDSEPKMLTYKRYITNFKSGSYYACSRSCAQKKIELTNIGKYGVKNPFESKEVKEKIKQTNIKNLGTEYPSQNTEVRDKVKKTLMDNYGVENPMNSAELKQKMMNTNIEKYAVDNYMKIPEIAKQAGERFKNHAMKKYGVTNIMKLDKFKEINRQHAIKRLLDQNSNFIYKTSKLEDTFELILQNLKIEYEKAFILNNKFYDFKIKDKNILIEVDGDFYHCNPKKYPEPICDIQKKVIPNDIYKNQLAESNGYTLIRFWEDDIKNNLDMVIEKLTNL